MDNLRTRRGQPTRQPEYEDFQPAFDWTDDSNGHILLIELSGFKREELRVQLDGNRKLMVSGERLISESKFSRFKQVFSIPEDSIAEKITGKFENGLLFIIIPKKEPERKDEPKKEVVIDSDKKVERARDPEKPKETPKKEPERKDGPKKEDDRKEERTEDPVKSKETPKKELERKDEAKKAVVNDNSKKDERARDPEKQKETPKKEPERKHEPKKEDDKKQERTQDPEKPKEMPKKEPERKDEPKKEVANDNSKKEEKAQGPGKPKDMTKKEAEIKDEPKEATKDNGKKEEKAQGPEKPKDMPKKELEIKDEAKKVVSNDNVKKEEKVKYLEKPKEDGDGHEHGAGAKIEKSDKKDGFNEMNGERKESWSEERVGVKEEVGLEKYLIDNILEQINKHKVVIATTIVAFSLGLYLSNKLRWRGE
ncbi:uncharacterized protein LOC143887065 [Tasmannia lanceolata]|uniref:uncharacterized protein LOC143887065 n=1 Tax=Tasmannia lanceolata TaxID=3420 RepID=UPI00406308F8